MMMIIIVNMVAMMVGVVVVVVVKYATYSSLFPKPVLYPGFIDGTKQTNEGI